MHLSFGCIWTGFLDGGVSGRCRWQTGAKEPENWGLSLKAPRGEGILGQRRLTLGYFGSTLLSFHLGVQLQRMNMDPDWGRPRSPWFSRTGSNTTSVCVSVWAVGLDRRPLVQPSLPFSWIFKELLNDCRRSSGPSGPRLTETRCSACMDGTPLVHSRLECLLKGLCHFISVVQVKAASWSASVSVWQHSASVSYVMCAMLLFCVFLREWNTPRIKVW